MNSKTMKKNNKSKWKLFLKKQNQKTQQDKVHKKNLQFHNQLSFCSSHQ
jgi:hypothetical protein